MTASTSSTSASSPSSSARMMNLASFAIRIASPQSESNIRFITSSVS